MDRTTPPCIVVGVTDERPAAVIQTAASFALLTGAELLCAWVDASQYPVGENPDGSVSSIALDPDLAESDAAAFPHALARQLSTVLAQTDITAHQLVLAGDPATALAHLAQQREAIMIIVGARRSSPLGTVEEFFSGSIATRLAHHQHRPVLVVPTNPTALGDALPWERG